MGVIMNKQPTELPKFPKLFSYYKSPDPNYEAVRKELEEWRVAMTQQLEVLREQNLDEEYEEYDKRLDKLLEAVLGALEP